MFERIIKFVAGVNDKIQLFKKLVEEYRNVDSDQTPRLDPNSMSGELGESEEYSGDQLSSGWGLYRRENVKQVLARKNLFLHPITNKRLFNDKLDVFWYELPELKVWHTVLVTRYNEAIQRRNSMENQEDGKELDDTGRVGRTKEGTVGEAEEATARAETAFDEQCSAKAEGKSAVVNFKSDFRA